MPALSVDVGLPADEDRAEPTPNERLVRKIFGLARSSAPRILFGNCDLPAAGLTYITGASGSGKSTLLKTVLRSYPDAVSEIPEPPSGTRVIDALKGELPEVIAWLGRFGLGEARILLTPAESLSAGQKERLKLARILWGKPAVVVCDEFLSCLDRLTARVVAFQFQKIVREQGTHCFVATAHDDLGDALFPDAILTLDFEGQRETVRPEFKDRALPESREIQVREGTAADYASLKRFHYMDSHIGDLSLDPNDVVSIRAAFFRDKLIGVRVFAKMFPAQFESLALFRTINERAALSSRVIVHPAFRGLGVSKHMSLPPESRGKLKKIFTHSALAVYFPFDRAAGYRLVGHVSQHRSPGQSRFVEAIGELGLKNLEDLNDAALCRAFWSGLSAEQGSRLRELCVDALADYDTRYTLSLLRELAIPAPTRLESGLRVFFRRGLDAVPAEESWKLLGEALPFPMEGLVKDLEP